MLGACVALGLINPHYPGLNVWLAVPLVRLMMAVIGYLMDAVILRAVFGQNQTSITILTIAPGFVIRFLVGVIWRHDPQSLHSPLAGGDLRPGGVVLSVADLAVTVLPAPWTGGVNGKYARPRSTSSG